MKFNKFILLLIVYVGLLNWQSLNPMDQALTEFSNPSLIGSCLSTSIIKKAYESVKNNKKKVALFLFLFIYRKSIVSALKFICQDILSLVFFYCINTNNIVFAEKLLKMGLNPNIKIRMTLYKDGERIGWEFLEPLFLTESPKFTELLVKYGADVNVVGRKTRFCHLGLTPYENAIQLGKLKIVKLLIASGKCLNLSKSLFMTIDRMRYNEQFIHNKYIEIVALLLENGVSPNITNHHGKTPLHITTNFFVAADLINAGANLDAQDQAGNLTPLMSQARFLNPFNDCKEIIRVLLYLGADTTIKDESNMVFYDYSKDKPEIQKIIEEFQADVAEEVCKSGLVIRDLALIVAEYV
ncbi:MAG: hypothetical protein P4L22_06315 [Candidatus Babeliales bacterium]|nr:hypothetical protein [Candidatus Babeliales bacterium]